MIIVYILIWLMCTVVTYGIFRVIAQIEREDEQMYAMLVCLAFWPILLISCILYFLFCALFKLGEFVAGFVASLFSEDKE